MFQWCRMLIAAFVLLVLATGCRYTAAPADLLQKPAISPDKQAIVQAIEESLPTYSKLTIPLREDQMEAIRLVDVDGDGTKEAIVSYYNEYSTPELMVFKNTSSEWESWVLIQQPLAWQIAWLKMADLDQNGQMELIVGWVGAFDVPNVLEIYSFQSKPVRNEAGKLALKPLTSLPYSYAESGDLSGDGVVSLAVISETSMNQEVALPEYDLTLYRWKNGGLQKLYKEKLFEGVNSYDRLTMGRVSERHNGLIVEGSTGAHGTYTAMYVWERGKLRLVYPNVPEDQDGISGTPTMSSDIDGDGILELQWTREAPGYTGIPYSDSKWVNVWVQWDGRKGYNKIIEEFSDYRYGIQLRIPGQWIGHYTLRNPQDEMYGVVTIDYWNEETKVTSELATLFAVPQKQWETVESAWKQSRAYKMLLADSGNVYVISFVKDAPADWPYTERQAFSELLKAEEQFATSLTVLDE